MSLDDTTLAKYIHCYGDRVALRQFCKRTVPETKREKRHASFVANIKKKLELKKSKKITKQQTLRVLSMKAASQVEAENIAQADPTDPSEEAQSSKQEVNGKGSIKRHLSRFNAVKSYRSVSVGWMHMQKDGAYRQVRGHGGSVYTEIMEKNLGKFAIIERAKQRFFPDGVSCKGPEDNFHFDLLGGDKISLPDSFKIGDKKGNIRVYLGSMDKFSEDSESSFGSNFLDANEPMSSFNSAVSTYHKNEPVLENHVICEELPEPSGPDVVVFPSTSNSVGQVNYAANILKVPWVYCLPLATNGY